MLGFRTHACRQEEAGEQQLAEHGKGGAAGLSMDRAIRELVATSKRGQLQGRVYGRLNSLARARDSRYVAACNAVLSEQCKLVRCHLHMPHLPADMQNSTNASKSVTLYLLCWHGLIAAVHACCVRVPQK